MTQTQLCRDCGDFYRIDDNDFAIETEDGWVIDICCQCQTEFNIEEQAIDDAWQEFYQHLCDENNDEGEPE